jgi:phosphatidylinositol glycan class Z
MHHQNLAKHGIHPRYLHLLVNFPLLYGLMAPLSIYVGLYSLYKSAIGNQSGRQISEIHDIG